MGRTCSVFALVLIAFMLSCTKADDSSTLNGFGKDVIIDDALFKTAPNDYHVIQDAWLEDDSLYIKFSASGCDGGSWQVNLIDANALMYSNPPQRTLRLALKDDEMCEAWITKTVAFHIKELQVEGNKVYLNIEGYENQLLYEY